MVSSLDIPSPSVRVSDRPVLGNELDVFRSFSWTGLENMSASQQRDNFFYTTIHAVYFQEGTVAELASDHMGGDSYKTSTIIMSPVRSFFRALAALGALPITQSNVN